MKVLFVCPGQTGGVQAWSIELASYLRTQGFDCHVLFEVEQHEDTMPLPSGLTRHTLTTSPLDNFYYRIKALPRQVRGGSFDVVYPNTSGLAYRALAMLADARPATIACCHLASLHDYRTIGAFSRFTDLVLAVSTKTGREIAPYLRDDDLTPTVFLNSVPCPESLVPKDYGAPLRICYAGRLDVIKRVDDVVRTAHALKERGVAFHMFLAGDGAATASIASLVDELGLAEHVRLLGTLDRSAVFDLMADSHVNLLLSANEGLPLGIMEGMSYGCVPIVTNVWSCEDVIDEGKSGHVVELGDYATVAGLIAACDADRAQLEAMSRQAFAKVRGELSNDVAYPKHLEVIERAIEARRSRNGAAPWHYESDGFANARYVPSFVSRLLRRWRRRKA